jgi:hypothetical protein
MKKLLPVATLLTFLCSCYNDKYDKLYPATPATTNTCDTTTIKYSTDIQPIINTYCAINGCHNASGDALTGNRDYTIFATLQSEATTALIVDDINGVPGRGDNTMPLNLPSLSSCDINKITRWVNEGAPNN